MNMLTTVDKIMSTHLITVTEHTPLAEARLTFTRNGIHHLPVVSPERQLVGIISQTDLLKATDHPLAGKTVGDVMTRGVASLEKSDSLRTAASLFTLNKFHALPVLEGGEVVGIVTTQDLIRLLDQEEIQLSDYQK